jgi:site-specific DNA-methyltransferase (adenine-specific)
MTPYYQDDAVTIWHGDSLVVMPTLPADSIDAIVTDPPYGLGFMGKAWDHGVPGVPFWIEAMRVAKPGAHLLAFGGTRTFHRLAVAIEDAGWEIRDCIFWCFGSGFPKSKNIGCKCSGGALQYSHEKETVDSGQLRDVRQEGGMVCQKCGGLINRVGYGSALKPAFEPIIMARKPLCGTLLQNVLKYGTGAINVDGCRVESTDGSDRSRDNSRCGPDGFWGGKKRINQIIPDGIGRWPANLIFTYPEDEYMLRDNVTPDQLYKLADWINENTKH